MWCATSSLITSQTNFSDNSGGFAKLNGDFRQQENSLVYLLWRSVLKTDGLLFLFQFVGTLLPSHSTPP